MDEWVILSQSMSYIIYYSHYIPTFLKLVCSMLCFLQLSFIHSNPCFECINRPPSSIDLSWLIDHISSTIDHQPSIIDHRSSSSSSFDGWNSSSSSSSSSSPSFLLSLLLPFDEWYLLLSSRLFWFRMWQISYLSLYLQLHLRLHILLLLLLPITTNNNNIKWW